MNDFDAIVVVIVLGTPPRVAGNPDVYRDEL
jgi:hypothetical protein